MNFKEELVEKANKSIYNCSIITKLRNICNKEADSGNYFAEFPFRLLSSNASEVQEEIQFVIDFCKKNDLTVEIREPDSEEEFLFGSDSKLIYISWG